MNRLLVIALLLISCDVVSCQNIDFDHDASNVKIIAVNGTIATVKYHTSGSDATLVVDCELQNNGTIGHLGKLKTITKANGDPQRVCLDTGKVYPEPAEEPRQ
jgi:hypothetical protein